jgi:hypothetical protein
MQYRPPTKIRNSLVAGLCGSVVHSTLMAVRNFVGVIPEFQPYDDVQCVLNSTLGGMSISGVEWAIPFISGALFVGFVFGKVYPYLPGSNFIDKGIFFGVLARLAMGLGFFPLIGDGVFSIGMGLGVKPAMLMFGMLLIYSLTMSFVYDKLNAFK